jgi:hypothetical protein
MYSTSVYRMTCFVPDKKGLNVTIPSGSLSPGIYLLIIGDGIARFSEKIVIIH